MKKVLLMLCAVVAVAVMGAEAKKSVWQLWTEGQWNNWEEVIKQAESGAVEVKGQEWVVLLAKYETKAITAEEYWKQAKAFCEPKKSTSLLYYELGVRIINNEPDDNATKIAIKADLDKMLAGQDERLVKIAKCTYARNYSYKKDFYQAMKLMTESGFYQGNVASYAIAVLEQDKSKAGECYQCLTTVLLNNIWNGADAKRLLSVTQKSAILANIPPAEVVATLTTIQRLYADRAVGDTPQAKEWGIFLGSLRDVIASWK